VLREADSKNRTLGAALRKSGRTFARIAVMLILVSFLVALAIQHGTPAMISKWVKPLTGLLGLPEELFAPVLAYIANPTAGISAIGALHKSQTVTGYAAALAALTGSLLSLPVFTLRSSLARNISVFGPGIGCANALLSLAVGLVARLMVILLLPVIWLGAR
jgi:hypothetical protein